MNIKKLVDRETLGYNVEVANMRKEVWDWLKTIFNNSFKTDGDLILDKEEIDVINTFADFLADIFDDYKTLKAHGDKALKDYLDK